MFFLLAAIFGLVFGSFLNACIWRAHVGRSVARGRSICPACQHELAWYDNIPLASFAYLRGRCRHCHGAISWQYPLVELATALLFVGITFLRSTGGTLSWALAIRDALIVLMLEFIFVYDLLYKEMLDSTTLIPAAVLFAASIFFHWHTWQSMLAGIGAGAGFFLLQYVVSRGRWIGGGDIRLGVLMGVILGFPVILVAVFGAYILGAVVSLCLLAAKKQTMQSETPFGTFLTIATLCAMVWGERIASWYVQLIKF